MLYQSLPQYNEVALRILNATDVLMAKIGVQNLSTHKIAKEANVSVGTIYLYFKDKETLLNQLIYHLFDRFNQHLEQNYFPELPLFNQYQRLWRAVWQLMLENPNIVCNMSQYESLPCFKALMLECSQSESAVWNRFVKQGQQQNVIVSLPSTVLFAMSIKVAWHLMFYQLTSNQPYSQELLDEVIIRTWKAMTF